MNRITRKGATVEAAVSAALQQLNMTRDEVDVEIVDPGKKGFLGFGVREAEVIVSIRKTEVQQTTSSIEEKVEKIQEPTLKMTSGPVREEETVVQPIEPTKEIVEVKIEDSNASDQQAISETTAYVKAIAEAMGIDDLIINHEMDGKYITFQLESKKAAFLIGKRGQTLNALQQLAQLVTNKYAGQFKVVRLDVGDYRDRREQSLEQFAERMADQAVRNGRKVKLEPMPSYERKVIHNALSNRLDIETYSEGTDPHRYLVIEPIN
ncbi:RNA-binding cell elongation regulator Jag/EloR [Sporosarcina thermotolerans]|uniref:RNA-binding protein KhpB n=1 Tax=Sporosarcina thermotolerans TaxID=633404 RepID=A0AAW9ABC4_9BACL|nr:RNA-binding cell elongation regulator Jag/EloR [Sporosarcina thermotolerans]MDW0116471.1 RNA-binding cell elongation regulator Jag/EloR [Sporosarcina thermotolerans]WHT48705.1 RNA-binding cell elongation regulator Jag/EloR [Sporosarcina thermotolerans]